MYFIMKWLDKLMLLIIWNWYYDNDSYWPLNVCDYNIQWLPLYEVNIKSCQLEGGCSPEGFSRREKTFRGLTTWFSPHMKVMTVLLYWNYLKMFITWICCFAEDNKITSDIENTITELDWKKRDFSTLLVVRGCRLGDNLLSPSTLYMFVLFTRLFPSSANFSKNIWVVFLLLYNKKLCKV
jgi:hypothetical protein